MLIIHPYVWFLHITCPLMEDMLSSDKCLKIKCLAGFTHAVQ